MAHLFEKTSYYRVDRSTLFGWHKQPGAFERLAPPWRPTRLARPAAIDSDDEATIEVQLLGPYRQRWRAKHSDYKEGSQFRDTLFDSPFKRWTHLHLFSDDGAGRSRLDDRIEYEPPLDLPPVTQHIEKELKRVFRYRHEVLRNDLELSLPPLPPLHIGITGAGGFIGSALIPYLTVRGCKVTRLVRVPERSEDELQWSGEKADLTRKGRFDVIIHLAGEPLVGRWSTEKKRKILASRRDGTRDLAKLILKLPEKPKVLISASATGFYGSRPGETLTEESSTGQGFLAEVCKEWEGATRDLSDSGIRTVNPRIGVVVSPQGGALKAMLPAFAAGLGGPLGTGTQQMSWIALEDLLRAFHFMILDDSLSGPVNLVSPNAVTNRSFTKTLGRVLTRPTVLRVPEAVLKLVFGEMAEEALLSDQRVLPTQLMQRGFEYLYPSLLPALRFSLGR